MFSLKSNFSIKDFNGKVVCQLSRTKKYSAVNVSSGIVAWNEVLRYYSYIQKMYNITQSCYTKQFTRIIWVPVSLTFTLPLVLVYFPYTNEWSSHCFIVDKVQVLVLVQHKYSGTSLFV